VTCTICGCRYSGDDILIYGCCACQKGVAENTNKTKALKMLKPIYCSVESSQTLQKRHGVPQDDVKEAIKGNLAAHNYLAIPRYL